MRDRVFEPVAVLARSKNRIFTVTVTASGVPPRVMSNVAPPEPPYTAGLAWPGVPRWLKSVSRRVGAVDRYSLDRGPFAVEQASDRPVADRTLQQRNTMATVQRRLTKDVALVGRRWWPVRLSASRGRARPQRGWTPLTRDFPALIAAPSLER